MAFTIDGFLTGILKGFGVEGLTQQVVDFLKGVKGEYPDTTVQIDKLTEFLVSQLSPYYDVANMTNTLRGIATDIISGTTGVNDDAWMTSV